MRLAVVVLLALGAVTGQPPPVKPSATITLPAGITSLTAIKGSASVAAGLADGQIAVWNGRDSSAVMSKAHTAPVLAIAASADGLAVISVAKDGSVARTSAAPGGGSTSRRLDLGTAPTREAAFSPGGAMLVTGGEFGELRVFDTASGALQHTLRGHRAELQSLAMRPGSTILASASAESDLRIWDTATGRTLANIPGDLSLFALAFSPRDGTLASGGVDRRLVLRDPASFEQVNEVALKAPKMVATLAWSADGRLIALGDIDDETLSKGGIDVLDASTRAVVATLDTGGIPARGVVFGDGGVVVAIIGRDLRAWPITNAKQ